MNDPLEAAESDASATEAAPTSASSELATLDADSPADVRVTFIVLMLAAAVLCALPRQWGSAAILLGLALIGVLLHVRASLRGRASAPPKAS